MRPAVETIQEGNWQLNKQRYSPALIFCISAIELLFKATLLRPVLYGLINNEGLAEIMVTHILQKTGIRGYKKLLRQLFDNLAKIELDKISSEGIQKNLFEECHDLQVIRNDILHKGIFCDKDKAEMSQCVAVAVYENIVRPLLFEIGLTVGESGIIAER